VLFVRGFRSKHSALAFEYAWQKPHSSRHTARMWGVLGMSKCSVRTSVSNINSRFSSSNSSRFSSNSTLRPTRLLPTEPAVAHGSKTAPWVPQVVYFQGVLENERSAVLEREPAHRAAR
jgi:hypothetical protein